MYPSKRDNIPRGHRLFNQFVIPVLIANGWHNDWQDQLGTDNDLETGIDYIVNGKTVAARVWNSYPQQHFSLRWYNTRTPDIPCELPKMVALLEAGQPLPNYTIEAFIYRGWVYVAVIDATTLWRKVKQRHPYLPQFPVLNSRGDYAIFCRARFDLFPQEAITKYRQKIN